VRQPPQTGHRRPAVGRDKGQLDVQPITPQQAHQHGGEIRVGAGDNDPPHRTGQ
jgi:hypothetical protein